MVFFFWFLSVWLLFFGDGVMAATVSSGSTERTISQTPTWAVATVCAVIIIVSICLEKGLHKLGTVRLYFCSFNYAFITLLAANLTTFCEFLLVYVTALIISLTFSFSSF